MATLAMPHSRRFPSIPFWLARFADILFFHSLLWIWGAFFVGNIILGIPQTLLNEGPHGWTTISQWWFVTILIQNVSSALIIGLFTVALTLVGLIAHEHAHPEARPLAADMMPVSAIYQRFTLFKQRAEFAPDRYFDRPSLQSLIEECSPLVSRRYSGVGLYGVAGVGKTRFALRFLEICAPHHTLLVWPYHDISTSTWKSPAFRRRHIAVLFDDLHEHLHDPLEPQRITQALDALRLRVASLLIIVTYRSDKDAHLLHRHFSKLFTQLTFEHEIPPITDEEELQQFRQFLSQHGIHTEADCDGTPETMMHNFERRTDELIHDMSLDAKLLLQAIALLRAAGVTTTESRVRKVAEGVFQLSPASWNRVRKELITGHWLQEWGTRPPTRRFIVPSDRLIDECLAKACYPPYGRTIAEDFPHLISVLQQGHPDYHALLCVSDALRQEVVAPDAEQPHAAEREAIAAAAAAIEPLREREPELWATVQIRVGIDRNEAGDQEGAITAFNRSLGVLKKHTHPVDWAAVQNNLGTSYLHREQGNRAENIETSIAHFESALTVYAPKSFPREYAETQTALAQAVEARLTGDPQQNEERATACLQNALQVITKAAYPKEYMTTQNALGELYLRRVTGDRHQHVEEAFRCGQLALEVPAEFGEAEFRYEMARTHNNLGRALCERQRGDHGENVEQGIGHHQIADSIYLREEIPPQWAWTQFCFGLAYSDRPTGDQAENIEHAIAYYQAALEIRTQTTMPYEYAITQVNLGNVYRECQRGTRLRNYEYAVNCYHVALAELSAEEHPYERALTLYNLGVTYRQMAVDAQAQGRMEDCKHYWQLTKKTLKQAAQGFGKRYARMQFAAESAISEMTVLLSPAS